MLLTLLAVAPLILPGFLSAVEVPVNGTVVQDFVHVDAQNSDSQRIAGPLVWWQLVPAVQLVKNNTVFLIDMHALVFDKFHGLRHASYVFGYRLQGSSSSNVTDFFRIRVVEPASDNTGLWVMFGVLVGLLVVLLFIETLVV